MLANVKKFLDAVCKQELFQLFHQILLKTTPNIIIQLALFHHHTRFYPDHLDEKCVRKGSQEVSLCSDCVTPMQRQGQGKWYTMVEVNGAYKYGRCEKHLVEKFACNVHHLSNYVFATQEASRPHDHDS